jgi:hypothetical protein
MGMNLLPGDDVTLPVLAALILILVYVMSGRI